MNPVARVGFFGANGPEEDAVYDFAFTGNYMLTMAVDRRDHLARVVVAPEHLVYLVDMSPLQDGGRPDARLYLDAGMSFDVATDSMHPAVPGYWVAVIAYNGRAVRGLFSQNAIQEIVPLVDDDDDISLLKLNDAFNSELWPELGHKR